MSTQGMSHADALQHLLLRPGERLAVTIHCTRLINLSVDTGVVGIFLYHLTVGVSGAKGIVRYYRLLICSLGERLLAGEVKQGDSLCFSCNILILFEAIFSIIRATVTISHGSRERISIASGHLRGQAINIRDLYCLWEH